MAYSAFWVSTDRISFMADHLTARFVPHGFGGRIESGYRLVMPWLAVTPYAALQAQALHMPGYAETDLGGSGFGLSYQARDFTDTRTEPVRGSSRRRCLPTAWR